MGFSHALSLLNVITTPEVSGYYFLVIAITFFVICAQYDKYLHIMSSYVFCECKDTLMAKGKYSPSFPEKFIFVLTVCMCMTNLFVRRGHSVISIVKEILCFLICYQIARSHISLKLSFKSSVSVKQVILQVNAKMMLAPVS